MKFIQKKITFNDECCVNCINDRSCVNYPFVKFPNLFDIGDCNRAVNIYKYVCMYMLVELQTFICSNITFIYMLMHVLKPSILYKWGEECITLTYSCAPPSQNLSSPTVEDVTFSTSKYYLGLAWIRLVSSRRVPKRSRLNPIY